MVCITGSTSIMAFALTPGHRVAKELRRLTRTGLRRAIDEIDRKRPAEAAVHEARKRVKKVRAILRLLRPALGRHYAQENDRLRAAARQLSSLRDADAVLKTFAALGGRHATLMAPTLQAQVQRGLQHHRRAAWRRARAATRRALQRLRRAEGTLPARIERSGGASAAKAGLVRGYRRARAAMKDLAAASEASEFHRWRRRVKDHWYQLRLFAARQRTLASRVRSLRRLETELGDDHDLAVLRDIMLAQPQRFGSARNSALVLGCIEKRQRTLRALALARGRRLFSAGARTFRLTASRAVHPT
jgi:CHAD domain-containing protein